jgi:hypothetical protein
MIRRTIAQRLEDEAPGGPMDPLKIVDDEFWTNRQIAERFAISLDTVEKAQNQGELPFVAFGDRAGRHPRRSSPKRAVLAWAASRLVRRTT